MLTFLALASWRWCYATARCLGSCVMSKWGQGRAGVLNVIWIVFNIVHLFSNSLWHLQLQTSSIRHWRDCWKPTDFETLKRKTSSFGPPAAEMCENLQFLWSKNQMCFPHIITISRNAWISSITDSWRQFKLTFSKKIRLGTTHEIFQPLCNYAFQTLANVARFLPNVIAVSWSAGSAHPSSSRPTPRLTALPRESVSCIP